MPTCNHCCEGIVYSSYLQARLSRRAKSKFTMYNYRNTRETRIIRSLVTLILRIIRVKSPEMVTVNDRRRKNERERKKGDSRGCNRYLSIASVSSEWPGKTRNGGIFRKSREEGCGTHSRNPAIILLLQQPRQSKRIVPLSIGRNSSPKRGQSGCCIRDVSSFYSRLSIARSSEEDLFCIAT